MKLLHLLCALALLTGISFLQADPIPVGSDAPKVTAKDQDGKEVKFEELYKKGPTVVFFYPKALTGG